MNANTDELSDCLFLTEPLCCDPKAKEFADCLLSLIEANERLKEAKKNVPHYTADHSDEDYYKIEQSDWDLCANNLYKCLNETKKTS